MDLTLLKHPPSPVTKNLHRLFNANSWFLLPEESIIDQYHAARNDSKNFPVMAPPPYKYTLVVNSKMGAIPIHRQKSCKGKVEETGTTDVDVALQMHSKSTYFHSLISLLSPRTSILVSYSSMLGARSRMALRQSITRTTTHLGWNLSWKRSMSYTQLGRRVVLRNNLMQQDFHIHLLMMITRTIGRPLGEHPVL